MYNKDGNSHPSPKRQYPPFYEKIVPIALGIILIAIIVLVFAIAGVTLGLLPGGG